MTTDSSDSEDLGQLKEAIDGSFLTDNLYNGGDSQKTSEPTKKLPPSLRNQNHTTDSINPFSIKVTPEFKKYVSEHLNNLLDEIINDSDIILHTKVIKSKHLSGGVKLLRNSKNFLRLLEEDTRNKKMLKCKKINDLLKDSEYRKRAEEVAVTSEWVLSKKETENWAPFTKGEVEVVKLINGKKFTNGFKKSKKKDKQKQCF